VQIFTNSDEAHAVTVLKKMGLEGCFEGIICFETLNQPSPDSPTSDKRILCKPSLESMEAVVEIAKLDPKKTVSNLTMQNYKLQGSN
jgi:putative hydrolase of the HAD superfamily/pyrimidine and pyridine-specific 5'-nucleotidase